MHKFHGTVLLAVALFSLPIEPARSQEARTRITENVDESRLRVLPRNTHPLARPEFDGGRAPADLALDRMLLVLSSSAERQAALETFLKSQGDKNSSEYHRWLTPGQFGERFGTGAADIKQVTDWLESHGFSIQRVASGKNFIEFSGTAGQVQAAFHAEIHKYVVDGEEHWANASDPQIPAAIAPVVAGVSTLHNFRKASQISNLRRGAVKISNNGSGPKFTASDGEHALSPADFTTIYNVGPVYAQGITGTGASIAVVARTNINMSDIQDFKNAFGVPQTLPQVVLNGPDPGDLGDGDEAEAVLDASWSAAIAPGATVKLVVSQSTNTTDGVDLSEQYIVDNNLADVMTESYGDCEANYTRAEGQFYAQLAQQAAAEGITYTVATGDSGATGCDDPGSVRVASGPVSVNILASTPYNLAIGGTEFDENGNTAYWATANGSGFASAQSYIPEVVWNESCTAAQCGSASAGIWAGSGGASIIFPKPSWQTGVAGIPDDGARDIPDLSLSSAGHDFYLLCLDGSCTTRRGQSSFSGVSGTSAATPSFAGIMALVVQSTGSRQGQTAAATLYGLAATESLASCNSANAAANCIFMDVTVGNNAVPGESGYGTGSASYQAGVGYDLATGLGSVNVKNLILAWAGGSPATPQVRIGIESPSSQNSSVIGQVIFSGWALVDSGSVTSVAVSVDSVPAGNASYGATRSDVCALHASANCPNVGWSYAADTTRLSNGLHELDVTVTGSNGQVYTASSAFTVLNWTSSNPMRVNIDRPNSGDTAFSGVASFGGWAIDDLSAITQVTVSIDGVSYGPAQYGAARVDVCSAYPGRAGCPNVGWNFAFDTAKLADGSHVAAVTGTTAGGQSSTVSNMFVVANTPANPITINIDAPNPPGQSLSGLVNVGGWAITTSVPIGSIAITIDGVAYEAAVYGGSRADVCLVDPGRPNCPNVGWNAGVDTTSLVNGLHILGVTASTATGQSATATRTFTAANAASASPVNMVMDAPSQDAFVFGRTTFGGWAASSSAAVSGVAIAIDGAAYGTASYGVSRPDVCAAYPASLNCPNVGWSFAVDTSQLADGLHTLTVTALSGGQPNTLSTQFSVVNWTGSNPMKVQFDNPNDQSAPLSGGVGIGGWALDAESAIVKIDLSIDGNPFGTAAYGGVRNDVCKVFTSAIGCPNLGWNYYLDTTLLSDGTHTLAATGATAAGQSSTFTQSFKTANGSGNPLHVNIDTPNGTQTLTGLAPTGGWAVDTNGAQVISLTVLVDGVLNGTATYGGVRADVCAVFPNGGGCPNVGWDYLLNTTPFANGGHTIEVRALAADGRQYTGSNTFQVANQP